MNFSNALAETARRQPDAPAILWEGGAYDYAAFEARVARLAGGLIARGLRPGAHVALAMENGPEFLPILYAIWRAGMVAVPVNAKLHPREFAWIFGHSDASLVFASPKIAGTLETGPDVIEIGGTDYALLLSAEPVRAVAVRPEDPAWIFYTSGTTGRPKGAVLTYRNLMAMAWAYFADVDRVGPGDVRLHAAPMTHGSGIYAIPFILRGAANLILPRFDEAAVWAALETRRNVSFFAAPTMVTRLMAAPGRAPGLKTLEYGGAPMYVADLRRAMEVFGPRLYQLYGQGEAPMTISHIDKAMHQDADRPDYEEMLASAGAPRTGVEVAVLDDEWRPLPSGEAGEIATRSDCVMAGYLKDPEATARAMRGGWLRTGDMGVIGETGLLTLKDRAKDMIISGGTNIYPREVEDALLTHPQVTEAAVVGAPDADLGERVTAFVVGAAEAGALDAWLLERIARFKRPRDYIFVETLPKNAYGKVAKTALRSRLT